VPTVAVLPTDVADQIAAGEVVERPASAVKELIENALDAGATTIDVEIFGGGRTGIRVSDDGTGMERADALLALQRHATSKIRRAEDLVGVRSFGFRGEALPAIASVSHLTLHTAPDQGPGTTIRVQGGTIEAVEDVARRRGTTVDVTRLFQNVPARLKFMRSARTEWRAVADAVTAVALARPGVHVTLSHDGRQMLALPPAPTMRARIGAAWGAEYAESLLTVDDVHGAVGVTGLVERPSDVGTRTRRIHIAVNGRAIRDPGMVRAAEAAYRSTIPAGLRPSLILELTVPSDAVDVNVHPAKAEVRFRDRWPTERAVEGAVRRALGVLASAAMVGPRVWYGGPGGSNGSGRDLIYGPGSSPPMGPVADGEGGGAHGIDAAWASLTVGAALAGPDAATATLFAIRQDSAQGPDAESQGDSATGGDRTRDAGPAPNAGDLVVPPLVQLRRMYMVFEHADGLVLIDQHSAHERVLYERFIGALEGGALSSQHLLFPLTLHLSPAAADAFDTHRELFGRLGFEAEGFGGHTLVVHAVPSPHPRFDAERCLRETLDALTGDRQPGTAARHERLAATIACKAAIKAGEELSAAEMRALFAALARTTLPAHDVHGRSTVVRVTWDEIDRRFGRR
jgi:DNA mismatch repair protein MutL